MRENDVKYAQVDLDWKKLRLGESLISDGVHVFLKEYKEMMPRFSDKSITMFNQSTGRVMKP